MWRKTLGTSGIPAYSGADGDGDGMIDQDDYGVWRAHFGQTLPPPGNGVGSAAASAALVAPANESAVEATSMSVSRGEPDQTRPQRGMSGATPVASHQVNPSPALIPASSPVTPYRPAVRGSLAAQRVIAANRRDDALVAWLASQPDTKEQVDDCEAPGTWAREDVSGTDDVNMDSVEQVFASLASD